LRRFFGNYPLVFFVGFFAFATALGIGSVSGQMLSSDPFLAALRSFGGGWMIAGFAMWIALLRDEAGQPWLSPLFALLLIAGMLILLFNVIDPYTALTIALGWGGLGANAAALLLGLVAMLISPAYPTKPTSRWPEGGEQEQPHTGASQH
jgi:hypothetical protein